MEIKQIEEKIGGLKDAQLISLSEALSKGTEEREAVIIDLVKAIHSLKMQDVIQLCEQMEEKYQVKALSVGEASDKSAEEEVVVAKKTEFNVIIKKIGGASIMTAIKALTGKAKNASGPLNMTQMKNALQLLEKESFNVLGKAVSESEAEQLKQDLEQIGLEVVLE